MRQPRINLGVAPSLGDACQAAAVLPVTTDGRSSLTGAANPAYTFISITFALILLVAAGLKAQPLLAQFPLDSKFNLTRAMSWAAVATEWALAGWLLSGLAAFWARRVAIALLLIFLVVAGWHLLAGDRDCGCFGNMAIHPAWTMALDAAALISIGRFGRRGEGPTAIGTKSNSARIAFAMCALAAVPAASMLAAEQTRAAEKSVVVLDPETCRDRPFPLLDYLDPAARADLASGRCTIILFDRNCDKCKDYLARLDRLDQNDGTGRTYAIDIAPNSNDGNRKRFYSSVPQLIPNHSTEFVADVPVELTLVDGRVVHARWR